MATRRRVVVTGLGAVTAVGLDAATMWQSLLAGRSGIGPIGAFDVSDYKVKIGAEIDSEGLRRALRARRWRPSDRALDIVVEAAGQALGEAGWLTEEGGDEGARRDIATILGSGVGPAQSLYTAFSGFTKKRLRGLRPTTVPRCMANSFSAGVSIHYRLTGPNYVIVSACASSTNAIGEGWRMIADGHAETVLCGGTDSYFDPFYYGVWNNLGVLSENPDPRAAYRSFDIGRDGCLLGEGAGVLILESLDQARRRGAPIRGEILGYGASSDATHITSPSVRGQVRAIEGALAAAAVEADEIGFINAHGTATEANDECEAQSIKTALGAAAATIPVAANKPYFGHLLGAAGAVETIVTLLGLEERRVPPNLNLERPDPRFELTFVGDRPQALDAPIAMKNSFGFGGGNAVLILRRAP